MIDQRIFDFQHILGNKLTILTLTYRHCTDKGDYPIKDLKIMRRCASAVYAALRKYTTQRIKEKE